MAVGKPADRNWAAIRPGLEIVKKMTTDDWMPEDVYMMLKNGGATLYIGEGEAGDYLGFIVLRLIPTFHGSKIEIWCAYSATKKQLMSSYWPQIQEIAKQAGANKITFSSAREEWGVCAQRIGFEQKQVSYEFRL